MRKQLFKAIANALLEKVPDIKYIDVWNSEMDTIEGGRVWPTPAVFVEFEIIDWQQNGNGQRMGSTGVRIHVITQAVEHNGTNDSRIDAALQRFDLLRRINDALHALSGEGFASLQLLRSATNHAHEELIEDIEVYHTRIREGNSKTPILPCLPDGSPSLP